VIDGSESVEDKKNSGSCNDCTYHDNEGYHKVLVLPIGMLTGRTTTAKEGMGIHAFTVAAGSCDGPGHCERY
jgi:hypothetical protein